MIEGIEYNHWDSYLRDFNQRNRWRLTWLTVFDDSNTQDGERGLPLVGISLEAGYGTGLPRIHIMLGDHNTTHTRHQTYTITNVKHVRQTRSSDGHDESLEIEDGQGEKNLLRFEPLTVS